MAVSLSWLSLCRLLHCSYTPALDGSDSPPLGSDGQAANRYTFKAPSATKAMESVFVFLTTAFAEGVARLSRGLAPVG